MAKVKDTVSEATEELSELVCEANRVFVDGIVAAQERNWKFAQGVFENEVELFKSHAEGTRTVMEKLVGEPEAGPAFFQSMADSAVARRTGAERKVCSEFSRGWNRSASESCRGHSHTFTHSH